MIKILFIGDTVGRQGRMAVSKLLPELKKKYEIDYTIMNGENLSHGKGMTIKNMDEMHECGVDFFTAGNHVWKFKETLAYLDEEDARLVRPANYPKGVPGMGHKIVEIKNGLKILIINLQGRVFLKPDIDCPFRAADEILKENKGDYAAVIVDFHAEATSEKITLKHYLDGRVSAVLGTHTHVQTADHHVTDKGTAYISDVGMVGKEDSIIGIDKESIIDKFLYQLPTKHEITVEGSSFFNAVLVEIDEKTAKAENITPIFLKNL